MSHSVPLISTLVLAIVAAFVLGVLARKLKLSPLIGYLAAGVFAGPFTPGFIADADLASQLAEIGIILLMFGVGLHFSLKDLLAVKKISVPGAIVQILVATVLGIGLATILGWSMVSGLIFGLCLSTASTVVLLRALEERQLLNRQRGQIAIGWLIVEDLVMVITLVLVPIFTTVMNSEVTSSITILKELILTLGKAAAFVALMLVGGRRLIPLMLEKTACLGSRELFNLAVLAIALGIAYGAAALFQVSFALGAFFAGMVLNETEFSHRAAEQTLPLRDAFAVLFFVSVGMLFDPMIIVREPLAVLLTLAIVIVGKSCASFFIVKLFRHDNDTALTISASLAQIGEFAFILAGIGVTQGLMPKTAQDLVLASAILSIMLNPFLFNWLDHYLKKGTTKTKSVTPAAATIPHAHATNKKEQERIIVVGYGKIGKKLGKHFLAEKRSFLVIENVNKIIDESTDERELQGVNAIFGDAKEKAVLTEAEIITAGWLFVTIRNAFEAGEIAAQVRKLNPRIKIITKISYSDEIDYIFAHGADKVVIAEEEIANKMFSIFKTL